MSPKTTTARHAKPRIVGRTSASTRFAGSAALVGVLILLVSAWSLPAQAHHRADHSKVGASPTKHQTEMDAYGVWSPDTTCQDSGVVSGCSPYRSQVVGSIRGSHGTSFTVVVTATFRTSTVQQTVIADGSNYFTADFGGSDEPPLTWTASTAGNDTHDGSQASGDFEPHASSPYYPPYPDTCFLSYDC